MLRQAEQPPGTAMHGVRSRIGSDRTVPPGPNHVSEHVPSRFAPRASWRENRTGRRNSPLDQRARPTRQILRQPPFVQGVANQRFCRSGGEVVAQGGQGSGHAPGFPTQPLQLLVVQRQPHRQQISQPYGRILIGRVVRMLLPPVHHPCPTGQFQRQPGQIPFPA